MRRVYDDTQYDYVSNRIMHIISQINPREVSEYDYGMERVQSTLIQDKIERLCHTFKFHTAPCTYGIGNNEVREIIYAPLNCEEEQICGLLHMTDDMFGGQICWCSDIDGDRCTCSVKVR